MKFRRLAALLLAAAMILALTGCDSVKESAARYFTEETYTADPKALDAVPLGTEVPLHIENWHGSGTASFTVNSTQLFTSLADAGVSRDKLFEPSVIVDGPDGGYAYDEDELIGPDGSLPEHVRFLLLDVTLTNEDASFGPVFSPNGEYISADVLGDVINAKLYTRYPGSYGSLGYIRYYSDMYKYRDALTGEYEGAAWSAVHAAPGESVTFQIGYFVGDENDDFSDLYFCSTGQSVSKKLGTVLVALTA